MFGSFRTLREIRTEQIRKRQKEGFLVGILMGVAAGYCANKYVVPKVKSIDYEEKFDAVKTSLGNTKTTVQNTVDDTIKTVKDKAQHLASKDSPLEETIELAEDLLQEDPIDPKEDI